MAKVNKSSGVGGKWLDKKSIKTGDIAKLKTEATEQPSQQGGMQLVAKIHVKGQTEPANVSINTPSKNALIDAYGDDTADWIDKVLTLHTEKTLIAGKRGIGLYLIPEGFEVFEDSGGYLVVGKIGGSTTGATPPEPATDEPDPDDIPF